MRVTLGFVPTTSNARFTTSFYLPIPFNAHYNRSKILGAGLLIQQFLEEFDKFRNIWGSVELTIAAGRKEDSWVLLGLKALLRRETDLDSDLLFQTDDLVVFRDSRPVEQLRDLLEAIGAGSLRTMDFTINIQGFTSWRQSFVERDRTWRQLDTDFPYIELMAAGKSVGDLVSEDVINRRLQRYGYAGLRDLTEDMLGFSVGYSSLSQVKIIAPIFLRTKAGFEHDTLDVQITYDPALSRKDLWLTYSAYAQDRREGKPIRERLDSELYSGSQQVESFTTLARRIQLPADINTVRGLIHHESEADPLDSFTIHKPAATLSNPLLYAFGLLEPRHQPVGVPLVVGDLLRQHLGLENQGKSKAGLELALLNLLAIQGFCVVFTGAPFAARGVDLIATPSDSGPILLISATLANNIGEKIRTLLPVWNNMRAELGSFELCAVIIAPVGRDDVTNSDIEDAKHHRIALILFDELEEICKTTLDKSPEEGRKVLLSFFGGPQHLL